MQIYLLRHGIAEDLAPGGKDADRRLTPEGRKRLGAILKRAAAAGVEPTLILSSPLVRARQTAEMAAKALGCTNQILLTKVLEPGGSPEQVWDELRTHRGEAQVLLAGHEPLFGQLGAFLLGAPSLGDRLQEGRAVEGGLRDHGAPAARHAQVAALAKACLSQASAWSRVFTRPSNCSSSSSARNRPMAGPCGTPARIRSWPSSSGGG